MNDRLIASLDEPASSYLPEYADTPAGKGTLRDHLGLRVEESSAGLRWRSLTQILEKVTKQPFETLVSERLWKPMGAGDSFRACGGRGLRDAADARIGDWMRIGELLANDGVFEGNQFTPPRYVALMLTPTHNDSPLGLGAERRRRFCARMWRGSPTELNDSGWCRRCAS